MSASAFRLSSPTRTVSADISVKNGALTFSGTYKGKRVWLPSAVGIRVDDTELYRNVSLKVTDKRTIDETYSLVAVPTPVRSLCSEMTLEVCHRPSGYRYFIDVRCFDDALAWRLRLPGSGVRRVNAEVSQWKLPQHSTAFFGERNSSWKLMTYAGEYTDAPLAELHSVSQQGAVQMMPLMCVTPDSLYLTVLESTLANYSGARLEAHPDGALSVNFTEPDGFDVAGDIVTPWRVLTVYENLDGVVNSRVLTQLAPPADTSLFADRSYIRPGRSVWSWWSGIDGEFMTEDGEKRVIDKAAALGFEYTTLDEGWEAQPDTWNFVKKLVDYGAQRGVGVFLWRHWNRLNNPADNYAEMAAFMDTVAAVGVKGLKIDYMNGEDKNRIDFNIRALQLAAERRLMVNFHGCQKPTGETRTYPNEITREAVRGLELNRITADYRARMAQRGTPVADAPHVVGGDNQCIPARHDVLLPLVRGSIGATDYTPLGFSMPGNTTAAHHLAMAVLLESPLLTMAENPFYLFREEKLQNAIPLISALPVVWHERHVLPSTRLGQSLIMAKRDGDDWFVAGVCVDALKAELPLNFLDPDSTYSAEWITDGSDSSLTHSTSTFTNASMFPVEMAANGGFLLRLKKI